MEIPQKFSVKGYNDWYNYQFKQNIILHDQVEKLRDELSQKLLKPFMRDGSETNQWYQLRTLVEDVSRELSNNEIKYEIIPEELGSTPQLFSSNYVKPTPSIINKMWRITKKEDTLNTIDLSNIKARMKDLVRFSIKTDSLKNSDLLAKEFHKIIDQKTDKKFKYYWDNILNNVWLDSEMKTQTGYFAYHFYFDLKIGIIVEMQIYSVLSDSWRTLSHKIYESVRDEIEIKYKFNDVHSRVISIGHLLYLADCELYNLELELKKLMDKK